MPDNAFGVYSLPSNYLAVVGTTIQPAQHNAPLEDIATALSARFLKNGNAPMGGNLKMGGHRVTGLADGTDPSDAATVAQTGFWTRLPVLVKTDDYTVGAEDAGRALIAYKATTITFALPPLAGSGGPYLIRNTGAGPLVLDPNGAEQIEGAASVTLATGEGAIVWATETTWIALITRPPPPAVPPGTVYTFFHQGGAAGLLHLNGQAVNRTTYAALFALYGTTYGAGNGSTTFNLPDTRGVFLRGFDAGRGHDTGRAWGAYQADELKSHTHTVYGNLAAAGVGALRVLSESSGGGNVTTTTAGGVETRPKNIPVEYWVKY